MWITVLDEEELIYGQNWNLEQNIGINWTYISDYRNSTCPL